MADVLTPSALSFGLRLRLMSLSTIKSKLSTVLVGARIGRYLVVEMPKVGGVPVKLDDETCWTVHFIHQGFIYTFETSVIGSILRPQALTFLRYPQSTEISPLRTGRRYPVNIPALISGLRPPDESGAAREEPPSDATPDAEIKALIVDISHGGCRLGSTAELPVGRSLTLALYLPDNTVVDGLNAEVKNSHKSGGTYYSGLLFSGFAKEESRRAFTEFMTSLELMPLRL